MRILMCCLVVCFFVAGPVCTFAQGKLPFEYEPAAKKHPRVQPRVGLPPETVAKLMQQRAMRAAENRRARIESRNWAGVSLLRPNLRPGVPVIVDGAMSAWWWGMPSVRLRGHWSR